MNPREITIRDAVTGPVLEIFGDLDHATADELRELTTTLALRPGQRLIVDLTGTEHCDSSGITALLAARNPAHAARAGLALTGVPAHILRVPRIAGLDQVFPFHPGSDAPPGPGRQCAHRTRRHRERVPIRGPVHGRRVITSRMQRGTRS